MNLAETMRLVLIAQDITGAAFKVVDIAATARSWQALLDDIPVEAAARAVKTHFMSSGPWITPADIRRRILTAYDLLPPPPEQAYAAARDYSRWLDRRDARPEPVLDPAVYAAVSPRHGGIGWSVLDGPEEAAHRRFLAAYRPVAERAAERAMETPLAELAAARSAPKALPAGLGVTPALPPPGSEPPAGRARELVRAVAARTAVPPPPRADYQAPSDIERIRQLAALEQWAAANGQPITTGATPA